MLKSYRHITVLILSIMVLSCSDNATSTKNERFSEQETGTYLEASGVAEFKFAHDTLHFSGERETFWLGAGFISRDTNNHTDVWGFPSYLPTSFNVQYRVINNQVGYYYLTLELIKVFPKPGQYDVLKSELYNNPTENSEYTGNFIASLMYAPKSEETRHGREKEFRSESGTIDISLDSEGNYILNVEILMNWVGDEEDTEFEPVQNALDLKGVIWVKNE